MAQSLRYGVFSRGQIWVVVCEDGTTYGFPDRDHAMDAADLMVKAHAACGGAAELIAQDELGWVRTVGGAANQVYRHIDPANDSEARRA